MHSESSAATSALRSSRPPRPPLKIRGQLLLLAGLASIPFLALSVLQITEAYRTARSESARQALVTARYVAARLDGRMGAIETQMRSVSPALRTSGAAIAFNDSVLLQQTLKSPVGLIGLFLQDTAGRNIGMSLRPTTTRQLITVAERRVFRDAVRLKRLTFGDVVRAKADTSLWVASLGLPLLDDKGSVLAVLLVGIDLAQLSPLIDASETLPGAVTTVFDETWRVLARSLEPTKWVGLDASGTEAVKAVPNTKEFGGELTGLDRVTRMAALTTMERTGWRVFVGVPTSVALAEVRATMARNLLLLALAMAAAVVGAGLFAARISQPITALTTDASTLADGDFSHRSTVRASREISLLAQQFNAMADTIETQTRSLRENEERYRALFEASPLPALLFDDATLRFLAVNDAAVRMYGWTKQEFATMTARDIRPPETVPTFEQSVRQRPTQQVHQSRVTHWTKSGTELEVEVSSTATTAFGRGAWLVVCNDLTQRERAEVALRESQEQIRQMQKIEAVGSLAAGIAHDFNNLLTSILGSCDLALRTLPPGSAAASELRHARDGAMRATELTKRLLAFSRQQASTPSVVDVRDVVRGMRELVVRTLGEQVKLDLVLEAAPCPVLIDAGQLEQVILNLLVNARDAMPTGGTARVMVRSITANEVPEDLPAHHWVLLSVSDTGMGMDAGTRSRAFEPFFTTKERGKGTGLGLAVVYGIVQGADGNIRVQSAPGEGTTFRVYLPRREPGATEASGRVSGATEAVIGSETVLLVEDEDAVRRVGTRMLESLGYRVLSAPDARTALVIADEHDGEIDVLVTDVIMPGMHGRELAETMTAKWPTMRVLFVSGYTDDIALLRQLRGASVAFLQKPFTTAALGDAVRKVLDG